VSRVGNRRQPTSPSARPTLSPRNIGTLSSVTDRRAVPARFGRSRVEVRGCRVLAERRHGLRAVAGVCQRFRIVAASAAARSPCPCALIFDSLLCRSWAGRTSSMVTRQRFNVCVQPFGRRRTEGAGAARFADFERGGYPPRSVLRPLRGTVDRRGTDSGGSARNRLPGSGDAKRSPWFAHSGGESGAHDQPATARGETA
jgi:hypothetical protein